MLTSKLNLKEVIDNDGKVKASALPLLTELVEQYPYYQVARMLLLRLLYQQHDSQFNDELKRTALYLPSRAKIYQEIEGDSMKPQPQPEKKNIGATHRRKSNLPLEHKTEQRDRTGELLDMYLNGTPSVLLDTRSGRPVDATTDYMAYLLQEESAKENAEQNSASVSSLSDESQSTTQTRITEFINNQGDKRITLSEKEDSELQKPTMPDSNSGGQQGAFTETLARIYIKQGKFEQAIEIIRRLSLKYPKKNRYFADQIRFLEKLIINNQGKKG